MLDFSVLHQLNPLSVHAQFVTCTGLEVDNELKADRDEKRTSVISSAFSHYHVHTAAQQDTPLDYPQVVPIRICIGAFDCHLSIFTAL